jgi:cation:H+ antiporter
MNAAAIACLPIFFTGHLIARWEGMVFLAHYAAYTAFLILDTTAHEALPAFSDMMLSFVVPITVLTLAVLAARALRAQHGGSAA